MNDQRTYTASPFEQHRLRKAQDEYLCHRSRLGQEETPADADSLEQKQETAAPSPRKRGELERIQKRHAQAFRQAGTWQGGEFDKEHS